jgi:capsule polysaccharide export protein KpsC/LpsZ
MAIETLLPTKRRLRRLSIETLVAGNLLAIPISIALSGVFRNPIELWAAIPTALVGTSLTSAYLLASCRQV